MIEGKGLNLLAVSILLFGLDLIFFLNYLTKYNKGVVCTPYSDQIQDNKLIYDALNKKSQDQPQLELTWLKSHNDNISLSLP